MNTCDWCESQDEVRWSRFVQQLLCKECRDTEMRVWLLMLMEKMS